MGGCHHGLDSRRASVGELNKQVKVNIKEQCSAARNSLRGQGTKDAYILCKEGLDSVVVDQQVGLVLDELVQGHVNSRIHIADNWNLNGLELNFLLAATHCLDDLGTALVTANTVGNVIEMNGGGECAGTVVLGTTPALFTRVCVFANLVAGLAVEETVIAALADNGSWARQTDRGIGLKLEGLH
jgi:hypothetical protein